LRIEESEVESKFCKNPMLPTTSAIRSFGFWNFTQSTVSSFSCFFFLDSSRI